MNDRTAGAPNIRPGASGPESLMRWDDDAAGREALSEIQRRLAQTWDVDAGLQEILLAERYDRAIEAQAGTFDVEEGLAEIVGPPSDRSDPWVSGPGRAPQGDGRTDRAKVYTNAQEMFYRMHMETQSVNSANTLHRIRALAASMEEVLEEMYDLDSIAFIQFVQYVDFMRQSVRGLYDLARGLEGRIVTRAQAVDVVDQAGSACLRLHRVLFEETEHMPLSPTSVAYLAELSGKARDLSVAVARLFDQSDDLVDVLL
ncbi:hypothetical protein ONO23_05507 [Micromonospora noduli]|uniref:hypothetical protein n=1 Tax=Micromonospora noduli TaxID=709876 RepID=UPI000DC029D1|nr:hypothetical protein [Micromonospora noduli]RAO26104.1 hypothetical protein ONO23_05507 [Micromonospora noduli]